MTEPNDMPYELESLLHADGEGPALRIDAAAADRLIAGAIDGAAVAPVKPLRGKRYAWLLAAALVITGSAAAMYAAQQARRGDEHAAVRSRAPAGVAQPAQEPPMPAVAAQPAPAEDAPVAVRAPTPEETNELARKAAPEPARASARGDEGAGAVQDLLRRANRQRGEGQYRSAERTYLRVVAQSPSGAPAYSARVAAAALRIERLNDARGALQLYGDALRADPNGPLTPEIHEGMAQAYRRLAQPAREQAALQALLAHQPDGPAAERARARLRELAPR